MSKKLIAHLLLFLLLILAFFYVKIYVLRDSQPKIFFPYEITNTVNEASLSLSPNTQTTSGGTDVFVSVIFDEVPAVKEEILVQLELGFDPNFLNTPAIFPGNYFENPVVLLEKIDLKNGRISYALSGLPKKGQGANNIIAITNFKAYNYSPERKEAQIEFLGKTLVKIDKKQAILKTTGAKVTILSPYNLNTGSNSAIINR